MADGKKERQKKTQEQKIAEANEKLVKVEEAITKTNTKLKELKLKKLELIEEIEALKK